MSSQITGHLLMIRPQNFTYNAVTAENNLFQNKSEETETEKIRLEAIAEFDLFVNKLRVAGVRVNVVEDTKDPIRPDAVFPNNWISFHDDNTVVTYPMFSPNRRIERRDDLIELLNADYKIDRILRLEDAEKENKFLEGTGSILFDRENKIAYACQSLRTDRDLFIAHCKELGYEPILFDALDQNNFPIYHTNVMMALGEKFCVICLESIKKLSERDLVVTKLKESGKEIIEISLEQMNQFAGNMLQVKGSNGAITVMSEAAFMSLNSNQIKQIEQSSSILYSDVGTIEKYGGGSVRCMMAEVFLSKR